MAQPRTAQSGLCCLTEGWGTDPLCKLVAGRTAAFATCSCASCLTSFCKSLSHSLAVQGSCNGFLPAQADGPQGRQPGLAEGTTAGAATAATASQQIARVLAPCFSEVGLWVAVCCVQAVTQALLFTSHLLAHLQTITLTQEGSHCPSLHLRRCTPRQLSLLLLLLLLLCAIYTSCMTASCGAGAVIPAAAHLCPAARRGRLWQGRSRASCCPGTRHPRGALPLQRPAGACLRSSKVDR